MSLRVLTRRRTAWLWLLVLGGSSLLLGLVPGVAVVVVSANEEPNHNNNQDDVGGAAAAAADGAATTRNAETNPKKKRPTLLPPPIIVGDLQPVQYDDSTTPISEDAATIRLPWTVTSVIGDYCINSGICMFFRDEILAAASKNDDDDDDVSPTPTTRMGESFLTEDQSQWHLQRPWEFQSSSDDHDGDSDSGSMDESNNVHYMYVEDEPTHTKLLSMLSKSGFDPVLESVGTYLGWDDINIYSMGFVGVTHAEPTTTTTTDSTKIQPLNYHLLKSNNQEEKGHADTTTTTATPPTSGSSRSYQLMFPMAVKLGSRPEFQIRNEGSSTTTRTTIKLRSEMDVGWLFGDSTTYGPCKFDYRDSPGEMHLAFTLYLANSTAVTATTADGHNKNNDEIADDKDRMMHLPKEAQRQLREGQMHWKKDGSVRLPVMEEEKKKKARTKESCTAEPCPEELQEEDDDELVEGNFGPYHYLWSNWSFHEFKDNLECSNYYDSKRPPPTESYWRTLRILYKSIVGDANSTLELPVSSHHDSFQVQVESRISPGRGRGIFAKEFIPKGTLVYHPKQQARFADGYLYKKLLMSVSVEAACDLLMWSSIQKITPEGVEQPPMIVVDLDNGALVNSGVRSDNMTAEEIEDNQDGGIANLGCIPGFADKLPGGCGENDFALTDIQVGEELLMDYSEYVNLDNDVWVEFGLANVGDDDYDDDDEDHDEDFDDEEEDEDDLDFDSDDDDNKQDNADSDDNDDDKQDKVDEVIHDQAVQDIK